jgi:hypothetical protein
VQLSVVVVVVVVIEQTVLSGKACVWVTDVMYEQNAV